jgi:phenylalanyl-tRNA synthetase beta chain
VEQIAKDLTLLGLEVEGVETHETVKGNLQGVVVGHVLDVQPHPNADRLRVAQVNVGNEVPLGIVCGAPNVAVGQKVLVALSGTTIYPISGEPLTLKAAKIRGVESNGMICALDELGLGTDHSGIHVLPAETEVGTPAAAVMGLQTDYVIEIGLTPNRTDAMSHYGVARDLAALHQLPLALPTVQELPLAPKPEVDVQVEAPDACPRYSGLVVRGVKVGESPDWLKQRLQAVGQRPINNVVDVTNYILHELGQPLHAFDLAQIRKGIRVRKAQAQDGEFTTLDGQQRKLNPQDLLIADAERGLCLAGVMGGLNSGVTDQTTDIFLESAYFSPATIRQTSRRLELHTDTAYRFARGTDPNITLYALKRAAQLLAEVAGGTPGALQDQSHATFAPRAVPFKPERIGLLCGHPFQPAEIIELLGRLEINVTETAGSYTAHVPLYRADVTREQDLAEEVLRIYGFNNVQNPANIPLPLTVYADATGFRLRTFIAERLAGLGYREILNNSLTAKAYTSEEAIQLLNPLSEALDTLRTSLVPGALEVIAHNRNRQMPDGRIFEFGRTYRMVEGKPAEREQLLVALTGRAEPEGWGVPETEAGYFHLKRDVESLLAALGLGGEWHSLPAEHSHLGWGQQVLLGKQILLEIGMVKPEWLNRFDQKTPVWVALWNMDLLKEVAGKRDLNFRELPRFPAVRRDLSLLLEPGASFGELSTVIRQQNPKLIRSVQLFDVYEPKEGPSSYALSITLLDERQTLTDETVDKLMDRVIRAVEQTGKARIRR